MLHKILDTKMRKFVDCFKIRYLKEIRNSAICELNNRLLIEYLETHPSHDRVTLEKCKVITKPSLAELNFPKF